MSARFSQIVIIYFVMGAFVIGAGVLPFSQVNPVQPFLEQSSDNGFAANNTTSEQAIDQARGPLEEALGTVAGGAVLGVMNGIQRFFGLMFWPITATRYVNAPREVVMLATVLSVTFLFAVFRVVKASV